MMLRRTERGAADDRRDSQALTSDLDLTVEENMNIYAKLYDVPAKERKKSIEELLELVDLTKWRMRHQNSFRRNAAPPRDRARPGPSSRNFFLDEPTTGLDPVSRVAVWEMLGTSRNTGSSQS